MEHSAIFRFFWRIRESLFQSGKLSNESQCSFRRCSMERRLILAWLDERQRERSWKRTWKRASRVEKVKRCKKMRNNMRGHWTRRTRRDGSYFTCGHCRRVNLHKRRDKDILRFVRFILIGRLIATHYARFIFPVHRNWLSVNYNELHRALKKSLENLTVVIF